MSTQIAIRLPDEFVDDLDELVASGRARSRAEVVATALRRDARRRAAERDVEILRAVGTGHDLDDLVTWASQNPTPID